MMMLGVALTSVNNHEMVNDSMQVDVWTRESSLQSLTIQRDFFPR